MTKSTGIRAAKAAAKLAALEERRTNPKSAVDAYWNYMEKAPDKYFYPRERKAWKLANPSFDYNGVTFTAEWDSQPSNSRKTRTWRGYALGSDGSKVLISDGHVGNRINDSSRNWGLGRGGNDV